MLLTTPAAVTVSVLSAPNPHINHKPSHSHLGGSFTHPGTLCNDHTCISWQPLKASLCAHMVSCHPSCCKLRQGQKDSFLLFIHSKPANFTVTGRSVPGADNTYSVNRSISEQPRLVFVQRRWYTEPQCSRVQPSRPLQRCEGTAASGVPDVEPALQWSSRRQSESKERSRWGTARSNPFLTHITGPQK